VSATASKPGVRSTLPARRAPRLATSAEILAVYAGTLLYIWRWQYTHVFVWIVLLAAVILSHIIHRDKLNEMGLTGHEFRPCARLVFPLFIAVAIPAVIYGLWRRDWVLMLPYGHAWLSFGTYAVWCSFQQYLAQSYFHRRLRSIIKTPHLSSLAVAIMFGGAHIPNPILMVATFAGGFILAEVFARHPNIWPLALVQAVAGLLIGGLSPASLIHHMRVGPGYYFYHLR
jgi:Type II CAAX prenyl endopeptidase Rce1-like